MAANINDYFTKAKERWTGQIGSGGVSDASVNTIPLASATGLPTDTAIYLAIDRVDSNGDATPSKFEVVKVVISGDNGTSAVRGVEGTAQAHSAGAVVEFLATAAAWNSLITGLLVEHNQDGTHNIAGMGDVTLTGTQTLTNKTLTSPVLNGDLTGDAILDEDDMASDSATKVPSQQSVKAYVDASGSADGWLAITDTLTYASATTFTVSGDQTVKYSKGTRIKLTQTSVKYFVVTNSSHSSGTTTVTITGGTDYTLANAAITAPFYSYQVNPQGYPGWFAYTTTYGGGWSADPATTTARFGINGKTCTVVINSTGPGTGTGTPASKTWTLPIAPLNNTAVMVTGDSGGTTLNVIHVLASGTTEVNVYKNPYSAWSATTINLFNSGLSISYEI